MHKRGIERSIIIIILVGAIAVFGIISAGVVYTALKTGTLLGYNITSPTNESTADVPNETMVTPSASTGCSLSEAYWTQGESIALWVRPGDRVSGVIETINCEGTNVSIEIYKRINGSDILVTYRVATLDESPLFSIDIDSSASNDTLYYFVVNSTDMPLVSIVSPVLGIGSVPQVIFYDPTFCNGFTDDTSYLYNVSTLVFNRGDGQKSFTSLFNGTSIRNNFSNEKFYIDHSNGALNVQYDIIPTCGGVDVVYTVNNPSPQRQQLPDFQIEGIHHPKNEQKYLYSKGGWGTLTDATSGDGVYYQYPYPYEDIYSPVMVAVNTNLSIGSSFEYPYMQYKQGIQPMLYWSSNGEEVYRYNLNYNIPGLLSQTAYINPGESKHYTITLRFSSSRNWLLTLAPYKKYFNSLYDSGRSSRPKDLTPVAGFGMSDALWLDEVTNPRGYLPDYIELPGFASRNRADIYGWQNTTNWILARLMPMGYKRTMMWLPSGAFKESVCAYCNFPPQFMDWLPMLVSTQSDLLRVGQNGLSLGFWWGHAGAVPVPNTWPPQSLKIANYSDPADRAFLEQQLDLAYQRGGKEIGLDAFTGMEPYDRYNWVDEMKQRAPGTNFIHEIGGPDFIHTKIGNFYTDTYTIQTHSWNYIGGPHLLSLYLNPNSEIWVLSALPPAEFNSLGVPGMTARARQLTQWGYTYVDGGVTVNVSNWNLEVSQCVDGMDNDNDGKVDWPRDLGCASEFDTSES